MRASKVSENFAFQLFITLQLFYYYLLLINLPVKFAVFFKSRPFFNLFLLFINKTLRFINLKTRTATNAKISVFLICVEAIIYLLLYNFHDCTFKFSLLSVTCKLFQSQVFFVVTTFDVLMTLTIM